MARTKTHHRVFALVIALVFLATAVGSSVLVVWQIYEDNKRSKAGSDLSSLEDQLSSQEGKKLEGTQLANFTPVAKVEKLEVIDTQEGTGEVVQPGASVVAHYTGALAGTGVIFQSSHDGQNQPIPFSLNGVIKGWTEGVPGMKVGGKRRLLIPAAMAYGEQGQNGIPPNSDLVFDIELVSVQN